MPQPKSICRLCLRDKPNIDIFSNEYSMRDKIVEYCGVNVYVQDGLPQRICQVCYENIISFVNFKLRCQENDIRLRKQLDRPIRMGYMKEFEKITFKCEESMRFFYDLPSGFKDKIYFEKIQSEDEICDFSPGSDSIKMVLDVYSAEPAEKFIKQKTVKRIKTMRTIKKKKKKEKINCDSKLCPKCGIVVKHNFDEHFKIHFKSTESYICDICQKEYHNKYKLCQHLITHGERKHPCEFCGKLFFYPNSVKKHIYSVHKKDLFIRCKICNKEVHKHKLKAHLFAHTGEKRFQCDICKKECVTKISLTDHIRIHTGEKPFKCKFCNVSFRIMKSLSDHERLHTGETPYKCSVCSRGYAQLSNLKSHFKNNHKGVVFNYIRKKPAYNK